MTELNSLEKLHDEWSKDSVIDETELSKESAKIPKLHSKYLKILSTHNLKVKAYDFEIKKLRKLKWRYFTGKLDEDELKQLGWTQFPYILKNDVEIYMEADEDLTKLYLKKAFHEEVVEAARAIMKELNSRTYQIRDQISWNKFINGVS